MPRCSDRCGKQKRCQYVLSAPGRLGELFGRMSRSRPEKVEGRIFYDHLEMQTYNGDTIIALAMVTSIWEEYMQSDKSDGD